MNPEAVAIWVQLVVSLVTLAGGAFWLGKLSERVATVQNVQNEMKESLFGTDGVFVRRETLETMIGALVRQGEATDNRITEQAERIRALERRER